MTQKSWMKNDRSPHATCGHGWHSQAQPLVLADIHGTARWQRTCGWHHTSRPHCGWESPQLRRFCTISAKRLILTSTWPFLICSIASFLHVLKNEKHCLVLYFFGVSRKYLPNYTYSLSLRKKKKKKSPHKLVVFLNHPWA